MSFLNLAAQTADMNIYGAVRNKGVISPDMIQNLVLE